MDNTEEVITEYLDRLSRDELLTLVKDQVSAGGPLRRRVQVLAEKAKLKTVRAVDGCSLKALTEYVTKATESGHIDFRTSNGYDVAENVHEVVEVLLDLARRRPDPEFLRLVQFAFKRASVAMERIHETPPGLWEDVERLEALLSQLKMLSD